MRRDIQNVPGLFEELVQKFPDYIAAVYGKQILTYGELNNKANQLAHYLVKKGISPNTPVGLCMPRSFDFLIAIMATLKAGGAYLPLDYEHPAERLDFLLKDSQAPLLISHASLKDKFNQFQGELILLDDDKNQINQQPTDNLSATPALDHLAYIIYTSGSTGTPKGVLIEHASVVNYGKWFAEYNGCQAQDRIDFSASLIFDMAVSVSLVPLMLGLTVVLCDDDIKKNPKTYLKYLAQTQINFIKITPSYFKILLQEAKNSFVSLPGLKAIILGGEQLSSIECKAWLSLYPKHLLFNEYGPTETTVATSAYKVCKSNASDLDKNVPIGKAGKQINYLILKEDNTQALDNEAGELLISGVCLARGYINRAELTAQKFVINPLNKETGERFYKTGDLCQKRADGVVEYLGRIDDQVKIRGFRIEPGEIEVCLAAHPAIKTVSVVAQKNTFHEQQLVAYYILQESCLAPGANQIRLFLQRQLPDYMIPSAFIKLDLLPLTANGKLDKAALPLPRFEASQHYIAPKTKLEKKLVQLWSEELNVKLIGIHDDFFELGGNSLSAARLVSRINHLLEKDISLKDFYQASCIAKLTLVIKKTKKASPRNTFDTKKYTAAIKAPLSDFQFLLWIANTFEPKAKTLNITARKRFQGKLNKDALESAFQSLIKKHEVLIYRILKLKPAQKAQKSRSFHLIEKDITHLSIQEMEQELETSSAQLSNSYHWPNNAPLLNAKLFYLSGNSIELQICMPHIISDDASIDILFADLSKFYLLAAQQKTAEPIETDTHYKKYVFTEQHLLECSLDKNSAFWEEYFQDASFFAFPKQHIVKDMKAQKLPYSTYIKIPKQALNHLKSFCEHHHITIANGLCSILAHALRHCCEQSYLGDTPFTVMNLIKSTRDNPIYDNSIGCFLRVEPIKIALNNHVSLGELSQQINQSIMDTSNYQQCSNLVKLSAVSTLNIKKKKIKHYFVDFLTPIGTKLLQIPTLYRKILQKSITPLLFFKRKNHFILNLNVRSNFVSNSEQESNLFGLKPEAIQNHHDDLLAIDYVFEACFFCDDNQKAHYLVISANLTPEFRKQIGQEVVRIMSTELVQKQTTEHNQPDCQLI